MSNPEKLTASDGSSLPVIHIEAHPLFPFAKVVETINNFKTFSCREDDIWVLAYSGSGTHWFWEIVAMLVNGKAERIESVKEDTMIEAMGEYPPGHLETISSPRILNTHLSPTFFPKGALQRGKFIYVVRNPKDACVSMYNHLFGFKDIGYDGSFTGYYELFRDGKRIHFCSIFSLHLYAVYTRIESVNKRKKMIWTAYYGDWFTILSQWWEVAKNHNNFLFLTYEEAKQDLESTVKKIAEFIQRPAGHGLLEGITDLCTFKKMKAEKKEYMKDEFKEGMGFYRKGVTGDWKNWFTVAQNEEYDCIFADRTQSWDSDLRDLVIFQ